MQKAKPCPCCESCNVSLIVCEKIQACPKPPTQTENEDGTVNIRLSAVPSFFPSLLDPYIFCGSCGLRIDGPTVDYLIKRWNKRPEIV